MDGLGHIHYGTLSDISDLILSLNREFLLLFYRWCTLFERIGSFMLQA